MIKALMAALGAVFLATSCLTFGPAAAQDRSGKPDHLTFYKQYAEATNSGNAAAAQNYARLAFPSFQFTLK